MGGSSTGLLTWLACAESGRSLQIANIRTHSMLASAVDESEKGASTSDVFFRVFDSSLGHWDGESEFCSAPFRLEFYEVGMVHRGKL